MNPNKLLILILILPCVFALPVIEISKDIFIIRPNLKQESKDYVIANNIETLGRTLNDMTPEENTAVIKWCQEDMTRTSAGIQCTELMDNAKRYGLV